MGGESRLNGYAAASALPGLRLQVNMAVGVAVCLVAIVGGGMAHAAAVQVFLSPSAWEQAVSEARPRLTGFLGTEGFDDEALGPLSPGANFFRFDEPPYGPPLTVVVDGPVRGGRVEDDATLPQSVDGSQFLLLEVGGSADGETRTSVTFLPQLFAAPPGAFAVAMDFADAEGVVLVLEGQADTRILVTDYLPTGTGFIGVLSDKMFPAFTLESSVGVLEDLGLDNLRVVPTPIPGALFLFLPALLVVLSRRTLSGDSPPGGVDGGSATGGG